MLDAVTDYLEKKCKFLLHMTHVLAKDKDLCIVALDDTQQLRSMAYKTWEKGIVRILKIIRRELCIRSDARAKWWWDHTCNYS